MVRLPAPFRQAVPADARVLADLVNFASEGMAYYVWSKVAAAGMDAWAVGCERARRETGAFSYRNAVVAEEDRHVVAGLISYPLPDKPEPIAESMPPMFVPLQELENLAPATWYVNVLAAYPEYRGKGYGSALLEVAEQLAADAGKVGLSIIVSDSNEGARRLYERCGYAEIAQRRKVKEAWANPGTSWVLLVKRP